MAAILNPPGEPLFYPSWTCVFPNIKGKHLDIVDFVPLSLDVV